MRGRYPRAGITDHSGSATGTYAYDAFGAVRSQTGATIERSYTGEQNDPTGLDNAAFKLPLGVAQRLEHS